MQRRILNHFNDDERQKIADEADVVLKQLAETEIKIGEDGATAAYAGVIFAHCAMLMELGKYDRVTAFFDDIENSLNHIKGIEFSYKANFESRPDLGADKNDICENCQAKKEE